MDLLRQVIETLRRETAMDFHERENFVWGFGDGELLDAVYYYPSLKKIDILVREPQDGIIRGVLTLRGMADNSWFVAEYAPQDSVPDADEIARLARIDLMLGGIVRKGLGERVAQLRQREEYARGVVESAVGEVEMLQRMGIAIQAIHRQNDATVDFGELRSAWKPWPWRGLMNDEPFNVPGGRFPINPYPALGNPHEGYRFLVEFTVPGLNFDEAGLHLANMFLMMETNQLKENFWDTAITVEPVGAEASVVELYRESGSRMSEDNPECILPTRDDEEDWS